MDKNWPKISIITACYNGEKQIEGTIKSVLAQSYPNLEYIVIDGQSTDRTLGIVQQYQHRIDRIVSEPDRGVYDAFNKGIGYATGDLVYFLNSDDYLADPYVIAEVAEVFRARRDLQIVYGKVKKVDEVTGYFDIRGRQLSLEELRQGKMMPHQGMFVRKELFDQYGLFDLEYKIVSVFDRNIEFCRKHIEATQFINRIIAVFRMGGISSKLANKQEYHREHHRILVKHFGQSPLEQKKVGSLQYYQKWLELLLYQNKNLSGDLCRKYGIRSIVIFGSKLTAAYLMEDFRQSGAATAVLLDNDSERHGHSIRGVQITSPAWLIDNYQKIDAIILSFEEDYEAEIIRQIDSLVTGLAAKVFSWKQLVHLSHEATY